MKKYFKKASLFMFSVLVFVLVALPQTHAATFTMYQADLRDGRASVGKLNDGGSTLEKPGAWKWLPQNSGNVDSYSTANTNYSTTSSVGIYNYSKEEKENYLEMQLPADFPSGSYHIYVHGFTAEAKSVGFRINDGPITYSDKRFTNSWYKLGQYTLTQDSKLRFSRTAAAGGVNLSSIQIKTIDSMPTNMPTGQEGVIKSYTAEALQSIPSTLSATEGNAQVALTWKEVTGATGYNLKRSTTAGGPYTTIASNVTATSYSDNEVTNDLTYYYVVTAVNAGEEGSNSNETSVTLSTNPTLNIVIAEDKVSVGQEVIANVALKNVTNIYAQDFTVGYDKTLFDYAGFDEVSGYKVYYKPVDPNGNLRFIVASQGQENGITGEKAFLKLKFKAKAAGTAKVDALKCRIADIEKEFDLNGTACGEDSLVIDGMTDVNRSGEYTLLDLAIDSYYYGQPASSADPVKYAANQAGDENVTNDDLVYIVNQILANTKYTPNN